jgi:site-specific DNA-methyltransferase (adenine-specific)
VPQTELNETSPIGRHIRHGRNCFAVLAEMPENSVDAVVTDPPYGLSPDRRARTWDDIARLRVKGQGPRGGFMGRAWDVGVPGVTWAREVYRVLKPGAHLVAFSATRTVHRLTCALEDAGFEVRDTIGWLTYNGFPKNLDISRAIDKRAGAERPVLGPSKRHGGGTLEGSAWNIPAEVPMVTGPATEDAKRWDGWGTALKPAVELIVMVRKPLEPGLTIAQNVQKWETGAINIDACRYGPDDDAWPGPNNPVKPLFAGRKGPKHGCKYGNSDEYMSNVSPLGRWPANIYQCKKPNRKERDAGCTDLDGKLAIRYGEQGQGPDPKQTPRKATIQKNHHPTVKPTKIMSWLLRLVTPPGGHVLEPFGGSGTTLVAAIQDGLDLRMTVAEREPEYCDLIKARAANAIREHSNMEAA